MLLFEAFSQKSAIKIYWAPKDNSQEELNELQSIGNVPTHAYIFKKYHKSQGQTGCFFLLWIIISCLFPKLLFSPTINFKPAFQ